LGGKLIKKLVFLLVAVPLFCQTVNPDRDALFSTAKTTSLTAAAEVLTVQHTVNTNRTVAFKNAYLYCSVACTVTLERNGTAASSTANTIVNDNPANTFAQTTTASAFNTSNVGTGTVVNVYQIGAGGFLSLDLSNFILPAGVADNLTLRSNSITGTVQFQLTWVER
jgi:hypothetical protein